MWSESKVSGSSSFLKKRTKRLLLMRMRQHGATANSQKSFGSFLQKRTFFAFLASFGE
jgi:hypothetical protein